jgi:hypothetical protein
MWSSLRAAYQWLVGELGIDATILVDGGIDLVSLAAKVRACIGFGAELRDGIRHARCSNVCPS